MLTRVAGRPSSSPGPWLLFVVCALACLGATASAAGAPAKRMLVVCSPGSPGDTQQAQPTMDAFASAVETAAKLAPGSLGAVYYESAEGGLPRLKQTDAALALVPLPFLLRYGEELGLHPRLEAVPEWGSVEIWSLVAKKGSAARAESLSGWEVTGSPGYAPDFIRRALLSDWGALPADTTITFTARAVAALRRAASGEKVAVLLDRTQTAALSSLPFGPDLEVVHRSRPFPSAFLCTIGDRLPAADTAALTKILPLLHESESGKEILKEMRLEKFLPLDDKRLDEIRRSVSPGAGSAR